MDENIELSARQHRMDAASLRPHIGTAELPAKKTPILIALTSNCMGAGKSEAAGHLIAKHGFVPMKFAGPLKDMTRAALRVLGYDPDTVERYVEGDLKESVIGRMQGLAALSMPQHIVEYMIEEMGVALLYALRHSPETVDHYVSQAFAHTPVPELGVSMAKVRETLRIDWWQNTIRGERDDKPVTARRVMQTIGSEWGRDTIRTDLWAHLAEETGRKYLASGVSIVIDDMRFPNELATVRTLGGYPLRIERPSAEEATGHQSEGALAGEMMPTIVNCGTLTDLRRAVDLHAAEFRTEERIANYEHATKGR